MFTLLYFLFSTSPLILCLRIDWSLVSINFDDIELSASDIRAFYIATTGQVIATGDDSNPLANDDNLELLNPGWGIASTAFGSGYSSVSW